MKAIYASPSGQTASEGEIIEVSKSEGEALIAGRYAVPVDTAKKKEVKATVAEAEVEAEEEAEAEAEAVPVVVEAGVPEAAVIEAPEQATKPRAKRGKKK